MLTKEPVMLVLSRKTDQSITLSPRCGASPKDGDPTSAEAATAEAATAEAATAEAATAEAATEKDLIEITVVEIRGGEVRLGIKAPRDVTVHRKEIWEQVQQNSKSLVEERRRS